jgi:hypothetical protein
MKKQLLFTLCLVLIAGCSGLPGNTATPSPSETDDPWEYRLVVENGYDTTREFTVTLTTKSGLSVVNETHQVGAGEQWVATTLTESEHSDQEYRVAIATVEEGTGVSETFNATPQEGVIRTSGATLYQFSSGGTEVHVCGGNVTCYEQVK